MASVSHQRSVRQGIDAPAPSGTLGTAGAPSAGTPPTSTTTESPVRHPSSPYPDPIPTILPFGSLSMLAGASGVGKTAFIAECARRMRDGASVCWHETNAPTAVGIIVGDRKWADHRQWFDAVGFPDILHYSLRDDLSFNWDQLHSRTEIVNVFKRSLDKLKLPAGGLLILDPISLFIAGNLNDYKTSAISMAKLDRELTARKLTTIGIAHTAKQKGDKKDRYIRPQDRILGSTALLGFTDTPIYILGPEEVDSDYYEVGWIPHHAQAETFQFSRHPETGLFVPYAAPNEEENLRHLHKYITEATAGTRTKDILEFGTDQLGVSQRTMHVYLGKLELKGKIQKISRGIWRRIAD